LRVDQAGAAGIAASDHAPASILSVLANRPVHAIALAHPGVTVKSACANLGSGEHA